MASDKTRLFGLITGLLGDSSEMKKDEHLFYCPFCNHHKKKLSVNFTNYNWKCWVCKRAGKSMYTLCSSLKVGKEIFTELSEILGDNESKNFKRLSEFDIHTLFDKQVETKKEEAPLYLPKEFIPLWEANNTFEYKHAMHYLKSRNISILDIMKYQIGYCDTGRYKDRIIIPSYDSNAKLNYYVARSFYQSPLKYINPPVSKNTVMFEMHVNFKLPIVLVEGTFDAIAVKRNVIPLNGVFIQSKLKEQIIVNRVQDIYICLDNDARKQATGICQEFMDNGLNVYMVELSKKDPSELGFKKTWDIIRNTKPLSFYDLIKLKL